MGIYDSDMATTLPNGHTQDAAERAGASDFPEALPSAKQAATRAANAEPVPAVTRNGGTAVPASYPKPKFSLVDRFIDEPRPLRVGVIGGGLAGVLAGILLPAKAPGIKLTIYEKNHDFVSPFLQRDFQQLA